MLFIELASISMSLGPNLFGAAIELPFVLFDAILSGERHLLTDVTSTIVR